MPGTYSQILLHIVFSTKHREPWITPDIADRLYPYMGGIVRAEKGVLYDIGGIEDHVHLYLRWRPDATISDLMRTVKARSSKWVNDTYPELGAFAWQQGYSVFTVSKSQEGPSRSTSRGSASITRKKTSRPNSSDCSARTRSSSTSAMCLSETPRGRVLPLPLRGRGEKTNPLPRVALRPPVGGLRSTRGYIPSPRWGEEPPRS